MAVRTRVRTTARPARMRLRRLPQTLGAALVAYRMRRGELFALTWPSVDLEGARVTVHGATAKSGRTRHLPLNSEALAVLRGWHDQAAEGAGLVFPGKNGGAFNNVRRS